ncbi:MAG: glycosyltransferase, partial [Chloroflexi bacterium]|nr:glycosyltransferase [Chloroflexota bacterium]
MGTLNRTTIHVLHLVPRLGVGGMELAMSRIVRELGKRGMRHSIVCLKGEAGIRDQFDDSVRVYCMNAKPNDPRLPWRLRKLVGDIRPTVIHARNWGAWPDIAMARLMTFRPAPLIFSFHGFDTVQPIPYRRRIAFRGLAAITTRVFTVSEASRRMLVDDLGLSAPRVDVIPNGVDTARFRPMPGKVRADRFVVGTAGSLTPVKNQALLVQACADLIRAGVNLRLRIAGKGSLERNLTELAQALGIAEFVQLEGHVDDMPAFLHGLDAFVLPSDSEANPNALLEAMACGLPCIATRVGGVPEAFDDGRCGILVDANDRVALGDAIRRLSHTEHLGPQLGGLALARVVSHYSMDQMIDRYDQLYRDVVCRGRRSAGSAGTDLAKPRPRILMLGPLPPPTGGMATVVENLRGSRLAQECQLTVINSGKVTPEGRSFVTGAAAQVSLLGRIAGHILRHRPQLVHIHTCSGFTFWRDTVHLVAARLLWRRVIWHIHGGYFEQFARSLSPFRQRLLRAALQSSACAVVLGQDWIERLSPFAPRARWCAVANGVPMPRDGTPPPQEPTAFLFLANLGQEKGPRDLISASALAARNGFAGDVLLAGRETEPGQKDDLLKHIAANGCDGRVRL